MEKKKRQVLHTVAITVRMTPEFKKRTDELAKKKESTVAGLVKALLVAEMKREAA